MTWARSKYTWSLVTITVFLLTNPVVLFADPITGVIFSAKFLISLAVSAAISAATWGLQVLLAPKAKPIDKNRLQGELTLTAIGEDITIPEIYGAPLPDNYGGFRTGGIIFYASEIRGIVVETQGEDGGGGGKGGPKTPRTREHHYFIDLAIMIGRGPLVTKQVKANTDIIFQSYATVPQVFGTNYEGEDNTANGGGVTEGTDADFTFAQLPTNAYIEWNNVGGVAEDTGLESFIVYKSEADVDIEVTVNGEVLNAVLPDSFNTPANIMLFLTLDSGTGNVVRIKNVSANIVKIDRLVVKELIVGDGPVDGCYISGVRYPDYNNPEPIYDYIALRDPNLSDPRGCEQWNYQANVNSFGETTANIINNGTMRIYEGTQTQLPDPLLQEYFESVYGPGSTPAFRGRSYIVLENFEITEYGTVPNFSIVSEHKTINTLGELFAARSLRAGVESGEFDYTDLNAVPLRGFAIGEQQAPAKEMELLSQIYDVDVYEDFDGVIRGVIPTETVDVSIPINELGSVENKSIGGEDGEGVFTPVVTTFRDDIDLPDFFDVSFFDPSRDFEPRNVHSMRNLEDGNNRKQNIETNLVLTQSEAQKYADRELHKRHVERDAIQVNVFHKHSWITPTMLIEVEDTDSSLSKMRVKVVEGWIPGSFDVKGVSRNSLEYPPRMYVVPDNSPTIPSTVVPAPIVGTFIDLATFRDEQTAGFYVCASLTDPHYTWKGAGVFREVEDGVWDAIEGIQTQAIMGRTVTGSEGILADVPGGWVEGDWDETNSLKLDLFNGELETLTYEQVLDGRNFLVVGDEIIQFATATRDNSFPNRWILTDFQRKLKRTEAASGTHVDEERVVLYTAAWKWVVESVDRVGIEYAYRFVGVGGDLDTASEVLFTWNGDTKYNTPIYTTIDSGVPILSSDLPIVGLEGANWHIFIKRPIANGYSAQTAEIRVLKAADDSVLRYIDVGNTIDGIVEAPIDDSEVSYRWQNAYRLNGSDGWSAWSNTLTILASTPPGPTPPTTPTGGTSSPGEMDPVNCFLEGTWVLMADWSMREIQFIEPGDWVMCWLPNGQLVPGRVRTLIESYDKEYQRLKLSNGNEFRVKKAHGFGNEKFRKVTVEKMKKSTKLQSYVRGSGWTICDFQSKRTVQSETRLRFYNFEVEFYHTYMVCGGEGLPWQPVFNAKAVE